MKYAWTMLGSWEEGMQISSLIYMATPYHKKTLSRRHEIIYIYWLLMTFTSWFINPGDLIFTEANGRGECKICRIDKSRCQPISKVINSFIICFKIFIMHHYTLKSFIYGEKNEQKFNCGLIKQRMYVGHHIMTSQ